MSRGFVAKRLDELLHDYEKFEEQATIEEEREGVKSSMRLTRKDDRGEMVEIEFTLKTGMPDMLIVEQRGNSTYSRIEMTMKEAKVFRYAMAEMERFVQLARKDDNDERDELF